MCYDFTPQRENLLEKRCAKSHGHFTEQNHEDRRAKRSEIVLGGTMSDVLHVLTGILPVKCVLLGKTHGYSILSFFALVKRYPQLFKKVRRGRNGMPERFYRRAERRKACGGACKNAPRPFEAAFLRDVCRILRPRRTFRSTGRRGNRRADYVKFL